MKQLQDDLDDFHGDESREYFTIDKFRAVAIANSITALEAERDRLKEELRVSKADYKIKTSVAETYGDELTKLGERCKKQLQARDSALDEAYRALNQSHGVLRGLGRHHTCEICEEALRAIEAAKEKK